MKTGKSKLAPLALGFFLLTLPFDVRVSFLPGAWGEKIRYTDFAFLLLAGAWLYGIAKRTTAVSRPPLFYSALLLLFAGAVSCLFADDHRTALIQLGGWGYLIALYFLFSQFLRERDSREVSVKLWVYLNACISLIAIISFIPAMQGADVPFARIFKSYPNMRGFPRLQGFSNNPNSFALDLYVAAALGMGLILDQWRQRKVSAALAIALLLTFLAFFLTASRLLIGLFIAAYLLLTYSPVKNKFLEIKKKALEYVLIVFIPLFFVLTIWTVMPLKIDYAKDFPLSKITLSWNSTENIYYQLSHAALEMAKAHPVTGVGLGNFRVHLREYIERYEHDPFNIYSTPETRTEFVPHNFYTGWLAETGLVGALAFVIFFGAFLLIVLSAFKQRTEDWLALSCWGLAIGFAAQGMINNFLFSRIFWFYIALAACHAEDLLNSPGHRDYARSKLG